ncbi:protein of unknown function [Catalinimonas alkaloidigena]|uniref:DUF4286 domain-containing protein n=1 Tax=Catalinimonas alkaloidigena TaxID=1075417 RepID=A0A1G9DMX1_9BACT|nr:DUF4286 family protein [Catalinimonas alkaloidigena]SDK65212.1 protein of unknown function [Catalinimonas alkaloidigena]
MILYNVTYNVDESIEQEWLAWLKASYLPAVLSTGLFHDSAVYLLHGAYASEGVTYSVQLFAESFDKVNVFEQLYAARFQQEHEAHFGGQFVQFQTLMERK